MSYMKPSDDELDAMPFPADFLETDEPLTEERTQRIADGIMQHIDDEERYRMAMGMVFNDGEAA